MARSTILDNAKRRQVLAVLAMGSSRRAAAKYVGCSPSTLCKTAARDLEFARQLNQAEQQAELNYLKNIRDAAEKPQCWRAAAWVLERRNPRDFSAQKLGVLAAGQVIRVLQQLAEIVVEETPAARQRKRILRRVELLLRSLDTPTTQPGSVEHGT